MQASARRVAWLAIAVGAGLAVWVAAERIVHRDRSIATSVPPFGTTGRDAATSAALPQPGSAVSFDTLLAVARNDLAAFTDWLEKHLAELSPEQRTSFLRELMRRWTVEWRDDGSGFATAFRELTKAAPATAGKFVGLLPSVPLRHIMVQELVRSWGRRDPEQAEQWIATLREPDDRSHALTALAEARLQSDAAAAMLWASAQLQKTDNPGIVQELTLGFAAVDPQLAANWTASLEAGAVKDKATVTLATTWADRDATKASQWATALAQSPARDDAVTVVGQVWTGTAPDEAIRWFDAQTFTSPNARALAFRDFSIALTDAEPEVAERWIGTIADPVAADAARSGAAESLYDADPEQALKTALKIQDLISRTAAVGDLMRTWREDDPEAAAEAEERLLPKSKKPAP